MVEDAARHGPPGAAQTHAAGSWAPILLHPCCLACAEQHIPKRKKHATLESPAEKNTNTKTQQKKQKQRKKKNAVAAAEEEEERAAIAAEQGDNKSAKGGEEKEPWT
jgi:hypothetical protein